MAWRGQTVLTCYIAVFPYRGEMQFPPPGADHESTKLSGRRQSTAHRTRPRRTGVEHNPQGPSRLPLVS